MTFMGITGNCSDWIEGYTTVVSPLRAMIKDAEVGNFQGLLKWTPDGHTAFETIRLLLWLCLIMTNISRYMFLMDNYTHVESYSSTEGLALMHSH